MVVSKCISELQDVLCIFVNISIDVDGGGVKLCVLVSSACKLVRDSGSWMGVGNTSGVLSITWCMTKFGHPFLLAMPKWNWKICRVFSRLLMNLPLGLSK